MFCWKLSTLLSKARWLLFCSDFVCNALLDSHPPPHTHAEPFYNELRTKKQLGYIVASGVKAVAETRTISFVVQSSVAPSDALTIEILSFLDNVESKILENLSTSDLAVYVKRCVRGILGLLFVC